jgi:hypothetical protein
MQYHIQTLVKHLFDKDSFEQVSVDELKQFTDDYPYAAVGQFLYAKKLKDSGAYNNYEQGEQASLYFHNALWLRWQLDQKEEVPALPAKAEEQAQQPGFRIVVQMPKNGPAVYSDQPEIDSEQNKEEEPLVQTSEKAGERTEPVEEASVEAIQPAAEQEKPLQVNEDGSLVEQVTPPAAQEETPAVTEAASAVAIAEISQLAGLSSATEVSQNAVNITEESLTPVAAVTENNIEADDIVPAVEPIVGEADIDDVIPAIEVPAELANPAVLTAEIDDIVPAIETEEVETDDVIPAIEVTAEEAQTEVVAEAVSLSETVPPEIAIEEQPEPIAEPVPTEEPVAFVAEQGQVLEAPVSAIPEEPEAAEPEPVAEQPNPFGFTPASKDMKISVDLGEPIFESYHTIDYFASQGIKLMAEDLKDKMGKQLKSFTDWLRSMKRVSGHIESSTSIDEVTHQSIQRIAEHSVEEKEVLTEAMAEVWAKQGNARKAIRVYEKLSLLNPAKSTYFATRIEQLKAQ